MSDFLDSEIVKQSVRELETLQKELYYDLVNITSYNLTEKKEHLERLKTFLEKQKIFFFRASLSDDPFAAKIKEKVIEAAKMFGYSEIDGMDKFFAQLDKSIAKIEQSIEHGH